MYLSIFWCFKIEIGSFLKQFFLYSSIEYIGNHLAGSPIIIIFSNMSVNRVRASKIEHDNSLRINRETFSIEIGIGIWKYLPAPEQIKCY